MLVKGVLEEAATLELLMLMPVSPMPWRPSLQTPPPKNLSFPSPIVDVEDQTYTIRY